MDTETNSSFETSEMLAAFVVSTSLTEKSWRVCQAANVNSQRSYAVEIVDGVTYLAFSGVQEWDHSATNANLVPLPSVDVNGHRIFFPFGRLNAGEEDAVMVHSGMLNLFLSFYTNPNFQSQMSEILSQSKSIVITGHSVGATIASLTTLWLLSYLQTINSALAIICITFGSPLLGNESLCRSILREQWAGNFCHIATKYDVVPRFLLAPTCSFNLQINYLMQFWHMSMVSSIPSTFQLPDEEKARLFFHLLSNIGPILEKKSFWPFGNYLFCSEDGAICLDNSDAIVKMMHVLFKTGSPSSAIEDHLKYGYYVEKVSSQFLYRRSFLGSDEFLSQSSYEAGLSLALQSSGISTQASAFEPARECLKMARKMGLKPTLKSAELAIRLSEITPYRAEVEWYKTLCERSGDQLGYYDSFKRREASKKEFKVNLNRLKLARFWDDLIRMIEENKLPHDFHRRAKWVNASQFYKLLVEPLDIAEYYKSQQNRVRGHYIQHGRPRRYQVFDKWWNDKTNRESVEVIRRTKSASATQDTCFWARVEEAKEWLDDAKRECNPTNLSVLLQSLVKFEMYAAGLVVRKEVSVDVLAVNSSYSLWLKDWKQMKADLQIEAPCLLGLEGNVVSYTKFGVGSKSFELHYKVGP